jgi:ABC-type branched-subunit amino acid transport system ATPase component/ABC-type branched-subunit amino acid transport system permease subunit
VSAVVEHPPAVDEAPARKTWTPPRIEIKHIVLVLLALGAATWIIPAPTYWIFTINEGMMLAASTLGLMVVVGWAREVSIMQAGLVGASCYLTGYAYRSADGWGLPFLFAALFGIGVVVAISVLVSLATARLSGIYIMILTLAVQVTIEKVLFTTRLAQPGFQTPRPHFLGINLHGDRPYYIFSLVCLGALMLFLARLRASRFGRALMLAGTDRQAASSVGVSPWRAKIFAFALAGLCAGVAGALIAPLYGTPPVFIAFISVQSLFFLAIPVLAGFRSIIGVVLVAVSFKIIPQALEHYHISALLLGGVGLLLGTMTGIGGFSGLVLDQLRALKRRRAGKAVAIDLVDEDIDLAVRESAEKAEVAARHAVKRDAAYTRALQVLEDYLPERTTEGDVLVAEGVSIAFGGLKALSEVSVTVPARTLVGLIGPNGAGKSTLFDIVNGLRPPDTGQITLFGQDITKSHAWDRAALGLSRTFQSSRVNLELTVEDNLLSGAYLTIPGTLPEAVLSLPRAHAGEKRAKEAAKAVAHLLGLAEYYDEIVGNLDFGAQRRVEIGRSLMSGPRLLLLDEPAAGLDATEAHALFALIRRLEADLGLPVLLVEHYVKAVLDNCDVVYVLSQGQIIAAGTPDEVANDPQVRAVYLGQSFERERHNVDA